MSNREKNKKMLLRVRIVCICSLVLTLIFLVANFLTANASDATGYAMFELLNLVSAPMLCSQYWILSLFLWACLLMGSFTKLPKE